MTSVSQPDDAEMLLTDIIQARFWQPQIEPKPMQINTLWHTQASVPDGNETMTSGINRPGDPPRGWVVGHG
jgi:hypothetical protein